MLQQLITLDHATETWNYCFATIRSFSKSSMKLRGAAFSSTNLFDTSGCIY